MELIVDGFERWQSKGFDRVGNHEDHYTVRLVACMNEVRRERNISLVPRYQHVEASDAMMSGLEDPVHAPRLDLTVAWGFLDDNAYLSVECKRIAPGALARRYVADGIGKFVRGYYGAKADVGGMVGYLIESTSSEAALSINSNVKSHALMGSGHSLAPAPPVGHLNSVFVSNHSRPSPFYSIRLTHLFFDMIGITSLE